MNTQVKHTPGPWVARHDDMVCSKEGRIIADCESTSYNMPPAPSTAEDKANARLIAAAPEMYEALRNLLEVYQDSTDDDGSPVVLNAIDALAQAERGTL